MNKGFTLAEVLITLGIIGVVAALTMPALIGNYQKKVVVERLKKVYATLKQVESKAIADYGDIDGWGPDGNVNYWSPNPGTAIMKKFVLPYVDAVKVCEPNKCTYKYKEPNGTETDLSWTIGFYLKDGTLIRIYDYHGGVSTWGRFLIDINGDKGPNIGGHDVFFIYYDLSDELAMCNKHYLFCFSRVSTCAPNTTLGCFQHVVADGWKIKNNYPWK